MKTDATKGLSSFLADPDQDEFFILLNEPHC